MKTHRIAGPAGTLVAHEQGDANAPAVVMTHSILCSSRMWQAQGDLLADRGLRVLRIDARGHGESECADRPATMDDLGADTLAVMDALGIAQAHYVGLSLGGMSGFGLGIRHADRIASLVLCDCRADAPPPVAAPWDERIAIARRDASCQALAAPTIERWFGAGFVQAHPSLAREFTAIAATTSVAGFVRCAEAIQKLDDLADAHRITRPTTLVVGENDGVLPEAMRELQARIPRAVLVRITDAGHLPPIDQPAAFDTALRHHFERLGL